MPAMTMNVRAAGLYAAYEIDKGAFKELCREALLEVAKLWVNDMLPKHFEHSAHGQYGYRYRSNYWNRQKNRGIIRLGGWQTSRLRKAGVQARSIFVHITPQPMGAELPLVATGDLKTFVLGNKDRWISNAKTKTRSAHKGDISAEVRIALSHPINTVNSGEMVRTTYFEREQMKKRFHAALRRLIKDKGFRFRGGFKMGSGSVPIAA